MKIKSAKFITSAVDPSAYPKDNLPQIVFAGRSNVGKSSFINSMLNIKNLARVSQTPGKTRLLNFFLINEQFYFVDIPGYGYAKASKVQLLDFAKMIEEYFASGNISLGVLLLDSRRIPSEDDLLMYDYFKATNKKLLIILTKADKLSNNQLFKQKRLIKESLGIEKSEMLLEYSTNSKVNHDLIWNLLSESIGINYEI
jgi:GTP-binding protein